MLKDIAAEYTSQQNLKEATLKNLSDIKIQIKRHCLLFDFDEFDEVDEKFVAKCLSDEFSKRYCMDKIFQERLEKFLNLILAEENFLPNKISGNFEIFRLLDDIKKNF